MELNTGDLVSHRTNNDIGFGIVLSKIAVAYGTKVCSVQWIDSGYTHLIDVTFLIKEN